MLGGAEEWFYRGLGGIDFDMSRRDPAQRITIRPQLVDNIDGEVPDPNSAQRIQIGPTRPMGNWVKVSYNSVLGKIETSWTRNTLDVTIPPNTQATIILPATTQVVGPGLHHFALK